MVEARGTPNSPRKSSLSSAPLSEPSTSARNSKSLADNSSSGLSFEDARRAGGFRENRFRKRDTAEGGGAEASGVASCAGGTAALGTGVDVRGGSETGGKDGVENREESDGRGEAVLGAVDGGTAGERGRSKETLVDEGWDEEYAEGVEAPFGGASALGIPKLIFWSPDKFVLLPRLPKRLNRPLLTGCPSPTIGFSEGSGSPSIDLDVHLSPPMEVLS